MSIEDAVISYDRVVHQSGSASLLALGMAVVLLGIVFGWFYNSLEAITIAVYYCSDINHSIVPFYNKTI